MSEQLRRYAYPLLYLLFASLCAIGMASQQGPAVIGFVPRLVLNLTLPLERNRLMALAQHVQDRVRATGRASRRTPPEQRLI